MFIANQKVTPLNGRLLNLLDSACMWTSMCATISLNGEPASTFEVFLRKIWTYKWSNKIQIYNLISETRGLQWRGMETPSFSFYQSITCYSLHVFLVVKGIKSLEEPAQCFKAQQVRCGSCALVSNVSQVGTGLSEGSCEIFKPIRKSTRQLAEKGKSSLKEKKPWDIAE